MLFGLTGVNAELIDAAVDVLLRGSSSSVFKDITGL